MALTINLTPGVVVTEADLLSVALLNLIANPTIELEGSVSTLAIADGSVTTPKLVDNVLSANAAGRAKMEDGYFAADAGSRAKFANGFITAELLAETVFQQTGLYATGVQAAAVYAVTLSPAATAYTAGMVVRFKADSANVGSIGTLTSITRVLQVATATRAAHGFSSGQYVTIAGAAQTEYNGSFIISNVTTDTFDFTVTGSPATPATGTITAQNNVGAVSVNVNALGAKALKRQHSSGLLDLAANDIVTDKVVTAVYDGTQFQVLDCPGIFACAETTIAVGQVANVPHGLGAKPSALRWVFINKTTELGYTVGDEVDIINANGPSSDTSVMSGTSTTHVWATVRSLNLQLLHKTTGVLTFFDDTKWKLKCYAQL